MTQARQIAALEDLLTRVRQRNDGSHAYLRLPFEKLPLMGPGARPTLRHEVGGAAAPPTRRQVSAEPGASTAPAKQDTEDYGRDEPSRVQTKPQLPTIPEPSFSPPVGPSFSPPAGPAKQAAAAPADEGVWDDERVLAAAEAQEAAEGRLGGELAPPTHDLAAKTQPLDAVALVMAEREAAEATAAAALAADATPRMEEVVTRPISSAKRRAPDTAPEIVFDDAREVELTEEELLAAEQVEDDEIDDDDEPPTRPPMQVIAERGRVLAQPPRSEPATHRADDAAPGRLEARVDPHSEEVATQPKPTLDPITQPKPELSEWAARSERTDTLEPVTQPRPEAQRISSPPPLPLSELAKKVRDEAPETHGISDPSTEVSGISEAPVMTPPRVDVDSARLSTPDPDAVTSKIPKKLQPSDAGPPPLPSEDDAARRPASKTKVSLDAPPSPTPAPVIQQQAEEGRKVIGPKLLQPPPLEAAVVGEFIGDIEAAMPNAFGEIMDAALSLEL